MAEQIAQDVITLLSFQDVLAQKSTSLLTQAGGTVFQSYGDVRLNSAYVGGNETQFLITSNGQYTFGNGVDGNYRLQDQGTAPDGITKTDNTAGATIFRLDRDIYCKTLIIDSTVTLVENGFRPFCTRTFTNNGVFDRSGNDGADGDDNAGGTGGQGGAGLGAGTVSGTEAGGDGGTVPGSPGDEDAPAVSSVSNSLGSAGAAGGDAGGSGAGAGRAGGAASAKNVDLIASWHLLTMLDISSSGATVKYEASGPSGGGGAATAGPSSNGEGGGGGSPAGILFIAAKDIVNNGVFRANGGNGGDGGDATITNGWGGGGGGGGNGGIVVAVYNSFKGSGTIEVSGGAGGAAGSGIGSGGPGNAGTAGSDGSIKKFQVSL